MKKLSLVKLIDVAILPIVILLSSKYLGLFLFGLVSTDPLPLGGASSLVSFLNLPKDLALSANTFSWGFVAIVLALYFGFLAFRNLHLNHDTIHPKQSGFFHSKNLEFLLVEAEDALHQNAVLLLLCFANIFFLVKDFFTGTLSPLVFGMLLAEMSILVLFFSQYLLLSQQLEGNQIEEKENQ